MDEINGQQRGAAPRRTKSVAIIVSVVAFIIVSVAGVWVYFTYGQTYQTTQRQTLSSDGNKIITKEEEDIATVFAKVSPSVVSVVTKSHDTSTRGNVVTDLEGAGSGIIVGKNGYILTNKHVIDGASVVNVILADGTSYDGVKVLGSDPLNDVAFLKISNVDNLPVAELGDSTSIRVGQKVVAIGNSLGQYQNTVTSGIISGTGRPVLAQAGESVENLSDLIQTDAAINPGNSGGPLLNLQGQVIGLNTALIKDAQGIGFSIPVGATKGMLKEVLQGGAVQRAYIGVNYITITAEVVKEFGLSIKKGAYVYHGTSGSPIAAGSPAEKAGLKEKDIIMKVGDVEVGDRGSVSSLVAEYAPGDTIELTVMRDGKKIKVNVTLAAYKS